MTATAPQPPAPFWGDVPAQCRALHQAGHTDLARRTLRALDAFFDALDDESDDAPDYRPLLDDLTRLKVEGHRLMGWEVGPALEARYPAPTTPSRGSGEEKR